MTKMLSENYIDNGAAELLVLQIYNIINLQINRVLLIICNTVSYKFILYSIYSVI